MATTIFPGNLIPFHRHDERADEAQQPGTSPLGAALLERDDLLERLAVMGEVGPAAPLSFLVVQFRSRSGECPEPRVTRQHLLATAGLRASTLLRPMDALGRWTGTSLGVALQGAGATAAAAVAARLSLHLNDLLQTHAPGLEVCVYAATGRGLHALMLPAAALEDIGECC